MWVNYTLQTLKLRRLAVIGWAILFAFAAEAQNYRDSTGSAVLGGVPLVGCSGTGSCLGPVSTTNPMPVSGLTGCQPTPAYTSLSVSTTSSSVALPLGATIVVYNVG